MSLRRASFTIPIAEGPASPWFDRTIAALFVAIATTLFVVLARVEPDARGHGTHEKLGLEACGWPRVYGMPCPTCGCTTAATEVVHGHLLHAFVTQPFGAAVAVVGLLLGLHGLWCLLRGRSFLDLMVRLPFWVIVGGGVLLLLASWGYKCLVWTV